jgi:hypothetical protein
LNPRWIAPHTLSRRADSAALAPLPEPRGYPDHRSPSFHAAVGSCATYPREPSQGREAAALSGPIRVPQSSLAAASSAGLRLSRRKEHFLPAQLGRRPATALLSDATQRRVSAVPGVGSFRWISAVRDRAAPSQPANRPRSDPVWRLASQQVESFHPASRSSSAETTNRRSSVPQPSFCSRCADVVAASVRRRRSSAGGLRAPRPVRPSRTACSGRRPYLTPGTARGPRRPRWR